MTLSYAKIEKRKFTHLKGRIKYLKVFFCEMLRFFKWCLKGRDKFLEKTGKPFYQILLQRKKYLDLN